MTIIVIPCFNEEHRIAPKTFISFAQSNPHIHFLFVNDGSQDKTAEVLNTMAEDSPANISTLHLAKNSGKAEAVRQGFLKAFETPCELIGYFDADLATPLEAIFDFENVFKNTRMEIVMGSRIELLGRNVQRDRSRHYGGRVFAALASRILSLPLYDTQCGAKIFRNTPRLRRVFSFPFTVRWIFDVEILARFLLTERLTQNLPLTKAICYECPLHQWLDVQGSKLKAMDFIVSGTDLWKILKILKFDSLSSPYIRKLTLANNP